MKTEKPLLKQLIVLSLLAVYLFVALVYVAILPKVNHTQLISSASNAEFFHKNNSTGSPVSVLHRGIRSVIENKRKTLVPATTACLLAFSFIFSALAFSVLNRKPSAYSGLFYALPAYSYLSLRTLRI